MNKKLKSFILSPMNLLYRISPRFELKLMFYLKQGYKLNLNNPITYNEKLNWVGVWCGGVLMPLCADKYTVRKYIRDRGYGEWLPKLLWEGEDPEQIPFEELPNQFVIKVTHGAGNNIICRDKSMLDRKKSIKNLKRWLKEKYIPSYGEWFYGIVKPRIIVEEFLSVDGATVPKDYKLFCFNNINGEHELGLTAVYKGRFSENFTKTIYNSKWELEENLIFGENIDTGNIVIRPEKYDEMRECAIILSKPFPHARVDFYIIKEKIYIGEITFMTGAGYNRIKPSSFNEKMGSWIKLPNSN